GLANVAFAHVNVDAQRNLASQLLEGSMIPQLVMFEKVGDNWKLSRLVGAQSVESVQGFIGPAVARQVAAKKEAGEQHPVAAKQPRQKPSTTQQSSTSNKQLTVTSSAAAG